MSRAISIVPKRVAHKGGGRQISAEDDAWADEKTTRLHLTNLQERLKKYSDSFS